MKERYWFRASRRGVGWVPATWQGWWIDVLYLVALIYSFIQVSSSSQSVSETFFSFLPQFFIFSAILIIITYLKGEPLTKKSKKEETEETS
jgi:hypothetical protein